MDGPASHCFGQRKIFADGRLDGRLFKVFDQLAKHPQGSLPQRLTRRKTLVGGYRMRNNSKVTHPAIIAAHRRQTLEQLAGYQGRVLLLHDTTVLDYSGLDVRGLGQVGDGHGKGFTPTTPWR